MMTRISTCRFRSATLAPATLVLLLCGGCGRILWRGDLRGALDQAAAENRMVVVWYWKPFNQACDQMQRTVFQSEDVLKSMQYVIPVRLHSTFSKRWAAQNEVTEVPSFLAIGPDGRVLRKRGGPMDIDQYLAFLSIARLSP